MYNQLNTYLSAVAICSLATLSTATPTHHKPHLRASATAPTRRLLQDDISDLNPLDFFDGIQSITYAPGNKTTTTHGYFDYLNNVTMMADAQIPIGSNSKLFTAVAIYQLQERGLLDVNADIATMLDADDFAAFGLPGVEKYCPQLGYNGVDRPCETITLKLLLGMSSGIYPTMNCEEMEIEQGMCDELPMYLSPGSLGAVMKTFILKPLIFKPGTEFTYSNPNFVLAQYFVEKYSGMTFQKYLQDNIFDPAGLDNTSFDAWNGALEMNPKRPQQYYRYYSDEAPFELMSTGSVHTQMALGSVGGTGGLLSTVDDVAKFYHLLFNKTTGGAPLLQDPASQKAIIAPITDMGAKKIPGGANFGDVHKYFGQGINVQCKEEECPNGPDAISYNGGTLTVTTANAMDYTTPDMPLIQIWTTSKVMMLSREEFDAVQEGQTGDLFEWTSQYLIQEWTPLIMALLWVFESEVPATASQSPSLEFSSSNELSTNEKGGEETDDLSSSAPGTNVFAGSIASVLVAMLFATCF